MATPQRHAPCEILRNKNIPCLVWFEDAIAHHGVPTVTFELHLLVAEIDEATQALIAKGWTNAAPLDRIYHFLNGSPSISHIRLNPPGGFPTNGKDPLGPTTTVLLRAADWGVSVDKLRCTSSESFVPPPCLLLDALVKSLLDTPVDTALSSHLAVHLSYLYRHCALLKTQDFASRLKLENRQFHYDALSKPGLGTIPFINEQRHVRDEIREGRHQPKRSVWYLVGRK